MNRICLDTKLQAFWLNYEYLLNFHISEDTISQWSKRNICERKYINGLAYINYDTIPEPSRAKLPNKEELRKEYNRQQYKHKENYFLNELQAAYTGLNVSKYIREMLEHELYSTINRYKITELARRASVVERILELHNERKEQGTLSALFHAYNTVYPNSYAQLPRFSMALAKAKSKGVLSIVVDKRMFRKTEKKYTATHEYAATFLLSHNNAYTQVKAYELFQEFCSVEGIDTPSFKWFVRYYKKNRNLIDANRYKQPKTEPMYASLKPAKHAGTLWYIDGWNIPINGKKLNDKGGYEKFVNYTLFAVMDSYSRKIVGSFVAESENTETILEGLSIAVKNTGYLPSEIIADNHSWNKTKIADNIKEKFEKLGVKWTIDSNPRRKGKLERSFRTLGDNHFKMCYGYTGQGVKSKIKNGRTQQVLLDQYNKTQNMLSYGQIVATALCVVNEYNDSIIKRLKDTPNNLHDNSEKPRIVPLDDFMRMELFFRESEVTIRNGQITLNRGLHSYEYQLPAAYYNDWNNKTVAYRRDNFEHIYLYDIETKKPICSLALKPSIHEASADQTDKDKELLFKNSGRKKGIESKSRKHKEKLTEEADTLNPAAFGQLNVLTTPKDTIEEVRRNHMLRSDMIENYGINPGTLLDLPTVKTMLDSSLKPVEKEIKSPFSRPHKTTGDGTLKKLEIDL